MDEAGFSTEMHFPILRHIRISRTTNLTKALAACTLEDCAEVRSGSPQGNRRDRKTVLPRNAEEKVLHGMPTWIQSACKHRFQAIRCPASVVKSCDEAILISTSWTSQPCTRRALAQPPDPEKSSTATRGPRRGRHRARGGRPDLGGATSLTARRQKPGTASSGSTTSAFSVCASSRDGPPRRSREAAPARAEDDGA